MDAYHAPSSPAPHAPPAPIPLAPEQIAAISDARKRAGRIRRAAAVASISGWTLACFAGLTWLFGLFSLTSWILAGALGFIAWRELSGAKRLRAFEISAPEMLAVNQIMLGALLLLYAGWGVYTTITGPNPYAEQLPAGGEVAEMAEPIGELIIMVQAGIYIVLAVIAVVAQSLMTLYHWSRAKHVRAYVAQTPEWVVQSLRAAA